MKNAYPTWFAGLALLLVGLLVLLPSVLGLGFAFTDWSAYSKTLHWVGLDNFVTIFDPSGDYVAAIEHTLLFTVATTILKTVIALGLAILLTTGIRRLALLHRGLIYLPAVLPVLVVGIVFKSILDPSTGLLNATLQVVGLGALAQHWLTDVALTMWAVIGVDTWRGVGYIMVILIAGVLAIPREYYEAAAIDGASGRQAFRHITVPMLMPVLAVTTVLNLLYGLRVFDMVFVLTNGQYGTSTVYTIVFDNFSRGLYGVATALSTLFFVAMIVLSYFVIRVMQRREVA